VIPKTDSRAYTRGKRGEKRQGYAKGGTGGYGKMRGGKKGGKEE